MHETGMNVAKSRETLS